MEYCSEFSAGSFYSGRMFCAFEKDETAYTAVSASNIFYGFQAGLKLLHLERVFMKKKILVVGAMYSLNLGDAVICDIVKKICENESGMAAELFSISGSKGFLKVPKAADHQKKDTLVQRLKKSYLYRRLTIKHSHRALICNLAELNASEVALIVFAGGQLFMEYFAAQIKLIVDWAQKKGIKVAFNCCGIGTFQHGGYRQMLKHALTSEMVVSITLRDGMHDFYAMFGDRLKAEQICDPALDTAQYYPMKEMGQVDVGIGLISPRNFRADCTAMTEENYLDMIQRLVTFCREKKLSFELFTNGEVDDDAFAAKVASMCCCKEQVAKRPKSAEELIATIVRYQRIVSFRLHSHIIATSYGIPTVGLVWDKKVEEFFHLLHRDQYIVHLDERYSANNLLKTMDAMIQDERLVCRPNLRSSKENLTEILRGI